MSEITLVYISGWQNRREILEENGRVLFEVSVDEHHCSICAERINHVQRVINKKSLEAHLEGRRNRRGDYVTYVSLPACSAGTDSKSYVAELLELPIVL